MKDNPFIRLISVNTWEQVAKEVAAYDEVLFQLLGFVAALHLREVFRTLLYPSIYLPAWQTVMDELLVRLTNFFLFKKKTGVLT